MYKSGDTFRDEIYVYDADGALVAPDSIDAAVLVVNGTDTAVSVTTDTSTTGVVKVSCSLAGRSAGDEFWVRLTATVDSVQQIIRTAKGRIGANVVEWAGFSLNPATSHDGGMAIVKAVDLNADALPNATTVAAIKAKTDNLPASPAAQTKLDTLESRLTAARAGYIDKLNVSGTLAHSDAADTYKADVSTLATSDQMALVLADTSEIQSNQVTILSRLGAWTGSARNTILGAFQALFRKDADASVPSDVNADLGNGTGTADNTTDSVQAIRDQVDASTGGGGSGDGARTVVITVTDAEASPLQNATVRLSEGAASFSSRTDAAGQVTFNVDDATYTVAITKAGYSFAGASLLVAGDDEQTYAMDAVSITPSAQPEQTTGHLVCYDEDGNTAAGVVIEVQLLGIDADGNAFSTTTRQETSGADGVVQFTNLWRGAYYRARRGRGTWVKFTAPDSASFAMPEVLGSP